MPIVVLRTGDAVPRVSAKRGEFLQWIAENIGPAWDGEFREVDARGEEPLPDPSFGACIIVTGSAASVTERAPWMLRAEEYLRQAVALGQPVLGICFGHQLLAQALGGHVEKNPNGREVGTVTVRLLNPGDPIFAGLPTEIEVNATHVDSVTRLPEGAEVLASTDLEPRAAFRSGEFAYGVQFHPEIDGDVMRGYLLEREQIIRDEGLPFEEIEQGTHDAPHGVALLKNFVERVAKRKKSSAA
jgi:GMP synthase (glutamine-hydrolysing)